MIGGLFDLCACQQTNPDFKFWLLFQALGPPPQSPEVLEPILTPAGLNQWSKKTSQPYPMGSIGRAEITKQPFSRQHAGADRPPVQPDKPFSPFISLPAAFASGQRK